MCKLTINFLQLIWEQSLPSGRKAEMEVVDEVFVIRSLEYDQEGTYTCSVEGHSELAKVSKEIWAGPMLSLNI